MKKLLIAALVLVVAYLVGAAVLAVAGGQAEGKIISQQKQLLADGDMEKSGTSDWINLADLSTITKEDGAAKEGERVLRIDRPGATGVAEQHILTVGTSYRVTGWARSDGSSYPRVKNITAIWTGTDSTDWQHFDEVFVAQDVALQLLSMSNGSWTEFDDVFLTEYSGKTTSDPKQLLADGDMEKSGTADFSALSGAVLTKQSGGAVEGGYVLDIETSVADNASTASQTVFTVGKTYRFKAWARGDGVNAYPRLRDGSGLTFWTGTTSDEWQKIDLIINPVHTLLLLDVVGDAATEDHSQWDDVFVTEYTGKIKDPYKQLLTDGDMESPPTLVANSLTDGDAENAGTSDWASVSGATLSKQTGSPHGGSQVLRIVEDTGYGSARPAVSPVVLGTTYIIRGYARSDGTRYPIVSQETIGDTWGGTTDTDWQYFSVLFTSVNGYIYLGLNSTGAPGGYVEFDDVTVQEVTDAGVSDWTSGNDAVLYKDPGGAQEGNYVLRVQYGGTNHPNARQNILTVGNRYRITGWARGDGGSSYPQVLNSSTGEWTGTVSTDWQRVDAIFTANDTYIRLKTSAFTKGASDWDDILITAL